MRSAFFGFHVASTALFTSRSMMNTTSHNLSNAEIPGFSRQQTVARANNPLWLGDQRGMYGTGSQVTGIIQIRDRFLDMKFWQQRAVEGRFTSIHTNLNFVETVFNQIPEDAGMLRTFNEFFSRMHVLSDSANNPTFRTAVVQEAASLAEQIRHNALSLQRQQLDINREIRDVVDIINSLGTQISNLNRQINAFESDGSNANDLRDQRALLIDELSRYVNISTDERDMAPPGQPRDLRFSIQINGRDFLQHDMVNRLEVVPRDSDNTPPNGRRNEMDANGLYDIQFMSGQPFNIFSQNLGGELRGLIDVRDGNNNFATEFAPNGDPIHTSRFKGIPFYMNQLNELARTFARALNEGRNATGDQMINNLPGDPRYVLGHINGFDLNDENRQLMLFTFTDANGETAVTNQLRRWILEDPNNPGQPLRDARGNVVTVAEVPGQPPPANVLRNNYDLPTFTLDYSRMNALNFKVNPDLLAPGGWELLAASHAPDLGPGSNALILGFGQIASDRSLFREGRLTDFIIATSNHLAVDNNQARRFSLSYRDITMQTHNHRLSVKGVDRNEEMMDLTLFQAMFVAAARIVNVMDSVYDTLINRLGNF